MGKQPAKPLPNAIKELDGPAQLDRIACSLERIEKMLSVDPERIIRVVALLLCYFEGGTPREKSGQIKLEFGEDKPPMKDLPSKLAAILKGT